MITDTRNNPNNALNYSLNRKLNKDAHTKLQPHQRAQLHNVRDVRCISFSRRLVEQSYQFNTVLSHNGELYRICSLFVKRMNTDLEQLAQIHRNECNSVVHWLGDAARYSRELSVYAVEY